VCDILHPSQRLSTYHRINTIKKKHLKERPSPARPSLTLLDLTRQNAIENYTFNQFIENFYLKSIISNI
jgi:hypothetical protein